MNATEPLLMKVPLGNQPHQFARQFAAEQATPKKGKRVYLNTLAVYAVHSYLLWLQIESDLDRSHSWHPGWQSLLDTADLMLPGKGRLECRPVLPGETTCSVPLEATDDRLGYVAVQLSESLAEATLLGFTPTATAGELPLRQLRPLEELLTWLERLDVPTLTPVQLGQWLKGIVEAGWQVFEDLLAGGNLAPAFRGGQRFREPAVGDLAAIPALIELLQTSPDEETRLKAAECLATISPDGAETIATLVVISRHSQDRWLRCQAVGMLGRVQQGNPEAIAALTEILQTSQDDDRLRWQAALSLGQIDPGNSLAGVGRYRQITLGIELAEESMVLVVALMPETPQEVNVLLQVRPIEGRAFLPSNLQLVVLDALGETFEQAIADSKANQMQLEFSFQPGERFSVKVALGDASYIEDFVG